MARLTLLRAQEVRLDSKFLRTQSNQASVLHGGYSSQTHRTQTFCYQSPGARHHRTLAEVICLCFDGSATIRSHWGLHGLNFWLSHGCSTRLIPGEFGGQVSPWALLSHSSAHFNASAQGFSAEHHFTETVNHWWITSPVGHWCCAGSIFTGLCSVTTFLKEQYVLPSTLNQVQEGAVQEIARLASRPVRGKVQTIRHVE